MSDLKLPEVTGEVKVANVEQPDVFVSRRKRRIIDDDKLAENNGKSKGKRPTAKRRLRHSNWLVTINTNKSFPDRDEPEMQVLIDQLKRKLVKLCDSTLLGSMVKFAEEDHEWSTTYIKSVDKIKPVIEVGRRKHFVHAHFMINISHYSCLQLDYKKLKTWFKEDFPGANLNCQRQYGGKQQIQEYIEKQLDEDDMPKVSVDISDDESTNSEGQ